MDWFSGKTAVVTGAGHGIGEGIARRLAALGARVAAIDRDAAALRRAFPHGSGIAPVTGDLAGDVRSLAASVLDAFGPPRLIVNNVGIDTPYGYLELDEVEFDRAFDTNLRGPWFFTKALMEPLLAEGGGGAAVFVSSLHGHVIRFRPHYSASKAAVAMLVKELAHELGPHGIRVNAVSPGMIYTDPGASGSRNVERLIPLRRAGRPEDVAWLVAVLLNDELTGYVTGANVPVDGGLGLHTWLVDE